MVDNPPPASAGPRGGPPLSWGLCLLIWAALAAIGWGAVAALLQAF